MERFATAGEHLKGSGPHSSRRDFLSWAAAGVAAGVAEALAGPPPRTQRGAPGGRTSQELNPEQQAIVERFAPLLEAVRKEGKMTINNLESLVRMGEGNLSPSIVPPERYTVMGHRVSNPMTNVTGPAMLLQELPCARGFCDQYCLSTKAGLFRQSRNGWEFVEPGEDTYEVSLVESDTGNVFVLYNLTKIRGNYRAVGEHTYIRGQYNLRDPRAEQAIRNGFPGIDALLASTIKAPGMCADRARACVKIAQGLHLPYQVITLEGASGWPGDLELYRNEHWCNAMQCQGGIVFLDGRGDRPYYGPQHNFVVCCVGKPGLVKELPSSEDSKGANRGIFGGSVRRGEFAFSVHEHINNVRPTDAERNLAESIILLRNAQAYRGQCTAQLQENSTGVLQ